MREGPAQLYEPRDGDVLYHYTSAAAALAILGDHKFWLSEYSKTNDSSEYVYARDRYLDAYRNRRIWIDAVPRYMTTAVLVGSEANTIMLIGCLTPNRDDLNQWRCYGDKGAGCVIGIDARFLQSSAGVRIRKVVYDADELVRFVNSGLLMLQTQYEEVPNDPHELSELASFFIADLFSFKHPAFASEQEVRISRMLVFDENAVHGIRDPGGHRYDGTTVEPVPVKLRDGAFGATRYVELPLLYPDGRSAIRSVGFGSLFPNNLSARFEELSAIDRPPLELWRSTIPYRG